MSMKENQFQKSLKVVEAGLQGSFPTKFVDFLWMAVKDVPDEIWTECCTRLALDTRKINDLVAGDFLATLREIGQEKARRGAVWSSAPKPKPISDWKGMAEKVCADPSAADLSKSIARNLAQRKDPVPAPTGGEKYRRQD